MVSSTPRPHFTPGKDLVPILQEAGWAPGPVWTGGKSRPHRDSMPDRPACSQSLYRLSCPAHPTYKVKGLNLHCDMSCFECVMGATVLCWSTQSWQGKRRYPFSPSPNFRETRRFLSTWNKKWHTKLVLCLVAVWCVCVCVCVKRNKFLLTKFLWLNYPLMSLHELLKEVEKINVTVIACEKLHMYKTCEQNILQQLAV